MKKTPLIIALAACISWLALADNSDSNSTTVKAPASKTASATKDSASLPESLLDNVLSRDVALAVKAAQTLKDSLQNLADGAARTPQIDSAFSDFVGAWKAVQTAYVAGELDEHLIDTPRLMDAYHDGKEDLAKKLARVVSSGDAPKVALFKNTFKSINALGFYLYNDDKVSANERDYALYTLSTLIKHLGAIAHSYQSQRQAFVANSDQSMSYVLNALIDSSYKLKEWRIGDPAGLSRKYQGKADSRRQEYPLSDNSLLAMDAILATHADMMAERPYVNLGSSAIQQGASKEVAEIRQLIKEARAQVKQLRKTQPADFASPAVKPLYETVGKLNDAYYQSLVQALPVQAKIMDADGD